jgi:Family of unknown function (DUF5719)
VSPTHYRPERRWPIVIAVVAVVAGVAVFAGTGSAPSSVGATSTSAALVAAPDAESSAWYCAGQSTASGGAAGVVTLTNTTGKPVAATVNAVSDAGAVSHVTLAVPAHDVAVPAIPALASGTWQADTVTLSGGGVAVSEAVHGASGWSQTPCQSTTSARWYFPGGTSSGSNALYLALLDPTSTAVVVDLSFITPTGAVHPVNYQGIVLTPGQLQVVNVSAEVQATSTISTVVSTRTGRVVAAQLQVFGGSSSGLGLVSGVPAPEATWSIPQAQEVAGATSEIDVFNPGSAPVSVTVRLQLPTGPLAPLTDEVAPGTTWALDSSAQTRIPRNETYSADIRAAGGSGVVVGRTVVVAPSSTGPQAGMAAAVGAWSSGSAVLQWVVPPPGNAATPAVPGAAPTYLALHNVTGTPEHYSAQLVSPSGTKGLAIGVLRPNETVVVPGLSAANGGLEQVLVRSDGPAAVSEDLQPSGGVGVVSMPGLPLAAPIGL